MKCIYCGEDKPESNFRKVEHVIPQSFGRFRNNLTLHCKVCDICNQYFGDNLESWLARDTYEGLHRFIDGIRPPQEYRSLGRRSTLRIQVKEGTFKGSHAFLQYREELHKLVVVPFDQIGFKLKGSHAYKYFRVDDFPVAESFDASKYDLNDSRAFIILGITEQDASTYLSRLGLSFRAEAVAELANTDDDTIETEVTTALTDMVLRTIAKIGFNYLACWNSTEIILDHGFDQLRKWVRYGTPSNLPLVHRFDEPILHDETNFEMHRDGHIVTVLTNDHHDSLFAQVSLFNFNTYKCLLCWGRVPAGVVYGKGHFFNLGDMSVIELTSKPAS